ncbi:TPA: hypothetical protein JI107_17200 [Acinetobacter baumannii]|nr:hypothetical protein [Acinetobacter baumannii]
MFDLNKEREAFEAWLDSNFSADDWYCEAVSLNHLHDFYEGNQAYYCGTENDMWMDWREAKAQTVPDTHILIPKEPNRKTIMAMACVCLGPVGSGPEFLTLKEAKDVYSALVDKESGAAE